MGLILLIAAAASLATGSAQAQSLQTVGPQQTLFNTKDGTTVTGWAGDYAFRPDGAPIPAGDVNGDGRADWIYKSTAVAAARSANLSDRTTKTILAYGGEGMQGQVYDQDLIPVGNVLGDAPSDAVSVTRSGIAVFRAPGEIFQDPNTDSGERGYVKDGVVSADLNAPDAVASTDLDADGHQDVVLVSASRPGITVLYGASTYGGLSVQSYTPGFSGTAQFAYNVADVDNDGHGEIIRLAGQGSITVDVFAVDASRALASQQQFTTDAFALGAQYLELDLQDVDGAGLTEILAHAGTETQVFTGTGGTYNTTPIAYRSYVRPAGDLNGDGRADFFLRDSSGAPFIAFGPSSVNDGLGLDRAVPTESGQYTYGNPTGRSQRGLSAGDLNADAHRSVLIGELAGDEHHEVFRQDVANENRPYVLLGDLSRAGSFPSVGNLPAGRSLAGLSERDRYSLLLDDQNHLLDNLFQGRHQNVPLKNLNGERPTGDLDADGRDELVIRLQVQNRAFGVRFLGLAEDGTFESGLQSIRTPFATGLKPPSTNPGLEPYGRKRPHQTINVGDWDGDGTDDLGVLLPPLPRSSSGIPIYTGDPTTDLAEGSPYATLQPPADVDRLDGTASTAVGDFDADGRPEVAVAYPSDDNLLRIYGPSQARVDVSPSDLGLSATTPGLAGPLRKPQASVANVGDVNDDGVDDLAVAVPNAFSDAATAVFLYYGGTLSATPDLTIDYTDDGASVAVGQALAGLGDVNGDGIDDFAVGDAYYDDGAASTLGAVYVHYGRSGASSFGAPDQTLTPSPGSGEALLYFPWGLAAGDFNGDGTNDLAAKPLVFRTSTGTFGAGADAIHVYEGGADFGGSADDRVAIPARPLDAIGYLPGDKAYFNYGELTSVPPAGSGADRLLVGTHMASNALLYADTGTGLAPTTILRAPDRRTGLGVGSAFMNLPNNESSAVGDFNGNGRVSLVMPQAYSPSFQSSPAYTYELDAPASGNTPPTAAADAYETTRADLYKSSHADSLEVTARSGVLANDADPDGDELTASLVTDVSNGTLQLAPDGGFKYVPASGFTGTDQFSYRASDGRGGTADATVTLQIRPSSSLDAVTSVSPGAASSGAPIRIRGRGFSPTVADNTVTIGGVTASVDSATGTALYARVPDGVAGPAAVSVTRGAVTKQLPGALTSLTGGRPSFVRASLPAPDLERSTAAWGDMDGDGDVDLALMGETASGAHTEIYENDGSGTFTALNAGVTDVYQGDLAWADYNRDGRLDLAVTGREAVGGPVRTRIYRTNGDGTVTPIQQLPPFERGSVDWADADLDGDPDLVVTGIRDGTPRTQIFENEGDDEFAPLGAGFQGVFDGTAAWGDVDTDGDPDLVVVGSDQRSPPGLARLYRNNGPDGFARVFTRLRDLRSADADWGDVDDDGDPDLVVAGIDKTGRSTAILYTNRNGRLVAEDLPLTGVSRPSVAWGDYDGDADLDLLVTGTRTSDRRPETTTLYENDGTGDLTPAGAQLPDVERGTSAWGDVDGDGDLDVLVSGARSDENRPRTTALLINQKAPFRTVDVRPTAAQPGAPVVLYGAGFDTTAANNTVSFGGTSASVQRATRRALYTTVPAGVQGPVRISVNNGDSTETVRRRLIATREATGVFPPIAGTGLDGVDNQPGTSTSVDWGDMDDDGDLDLVTAGSNGTITVARIYQNDGSGAFTQLGTAINNVREARWGDVDDDGDLDLLVHRGGEFAPTSELQLFLNDGTGTFSEDARLGVPLADEASLQWGDYNGDGRLDVLAAGVESGSEVSSTAVFRNDGDTFTRMYVGLPFSVEARWFDYDADGDLDVAISGDPVEQTAPAVYRNDGDGQFQALPLGLGELSSASIRWGDVDGDGDGDLLLSGNRRDPDTGFFTPVLSLLVNDGSDEFREQPLQIDADHGGAVDWGDWDADGDLDLAANGPDETVLYQNLGADGFRETATALANVNQNGALQWGDANGDGVLDLVVVGRNDAGTGSAAVYRGIPAGVSVPSSPSGLTARAPQDSIALDWTASGASDVETYRIYRDTTALSSVDRAAFDTVSADQTTYVDAQVAPETVYRYRVTAVDTLGHESAPTGEVQAMLDGVTIAGLAVSSGWALASVPVDVPDSTFAEVLPQCDSGFAFQPGSGYSAIQPSDPVSPGQGFFAHCTGGSTAVTGRVPSPSTVEVTAGWNLIGPYTQSVDVASITSVPAGIVTSQFYGLESGYTAQSTLQPGDGYWVRASADGTLDLSGGSSTSETANAKDDRDSPGVRLVLQDAKGRTAAVHLMKEANSLVPGRYALPPTPPASMFDIRFADDTRAARFATGSGSPSFQALVLQGVAPPLHVRLRGATDGQAVLLKTGADNSALELSAERSSVSVDASSQPLKVALRAAPTEFALGKHYPNPTTQRATVEYALPEQADVTIALYDLLGRRVATLVDAPKRAGRHRAQVDAGRLASGTYFYRMRAGSFTKTRRLVVVK